MAMKEEQGMRRAMLGWWAFLFSCLTTGSEEGLLEEGLDVSLVARVSTWGEALTSLCSCLGDCLLPVPAWVIDGLLFIPALGKGRGCFVQLHGIKPPCRTPPLTLPHTGLPRHNQVL